MIPGKILIIVVLLVCVSLQQYAQNQIKKGVYTLSGSIYGNYSKGEYGSTTDETYNINVNPSYGYFITDNILISGFVAFSYYEDKYTSSSGRTSSFIMRSLAIGPSARYYFNSSSIIPFVGVNTSYAKYLGEDGYGIKFGAEGGINFFLSNSVALEPFLEYSIMKYYKPEETNREIKVGIRVNYYIVK